MYWRLKSTIQEIFMSQRSVCNTSECSHSFSLWEVVISVRLLWGVLGGWDTVSVVCWVLSKSGPVLCWKSLMRLFPSVTRKHTDWHDSIVSQFFSHSRGWSFIHSIIWTAQKSLWFRRVAQILILFWFILFYFTFYYTPSLSPFLFMYLFNLFCFIFT